MTLILTCVTPDFVVQVSDRRLTSLTGETREVEQNKAVLVCSFAAFAYAGLAQLGRLPTDEWLLEYLSKDENFLLRLRAMAEAASVAISRTVIRTTRPLTGSERRSIVRVALVATGFLGFRRPELAPRRPTADGLYPFLAVVSNFYEAPGRWLAEARPTFEPTLHFLQEGEEPLLFASGQRLRAAEEVMLRRLIQRCMARSASPYAVARLLAAQVRTVSSRNTSVGRNVMCVVLPRPERPGALHVTSPSIPVGANRVSEIDLFRRPIGPDWLPHYIYSPGDSANLVFYGPNVACAGWQLKGLRHGPSNEAR